MIRSILALDHLEAAVLVPRQGLEQAVVLGLRLRLKLSGSLSMALDLLSEVTWSPYGLSNDGPPDNRSVIVITSN